MSILDASEYEELRVLSDPASGLAGFLVIHDTTRGPALGGIRVHTYPSEEAARVEASRLARAMTLKNALADLPAGGGKMVIRADTLTDRRAAFEVFGGVIESYGGRFYTAGDLGTTAEDIELLRSLTRWVCHEGPDGVDSLYEATALGASYALETAARRVLGASRLEGLSVALQGVGGVGSCLARRLALEGVRLAVADVDAARASSVAEQTGARVVPASEILTTPCDVLVPCATSGVLDSKSIPHLRTRLVVGVANNVLADELRDSRELTRRGIVFVPDIIANAGAVIQGAMFLSEGRRSSPDMIARIAQTVDEVLERAERLGRSTIRVAEDLALARLGRDRS